MATQDATKWWGVYEANVKGPFLATQAAMKNINAKEGILLNVSSGACHVPFAPQYSAYATSKIGFAKAFEYLHYEHPDLKFFNVQPGIIESTGIASQAARDTGVHWPQQDTGTSSRIRLFLDLSGMADFHFKLNFPGTSWYGFAQKGPS